MPADLSSESVEPRRTPVQERARERVEKILAATEALLVEVGLRELKMNHVARRADVPIGSVYQYFPNREAIVRALVERYHERFTARLEALIADVSDFPGLIVATTLAFDLLADSYGGNPAVRQLWSGSQSFEPLRALDIEDTMRNAEVIRAGVCRVMPGLARERAMAACVMLCDAAGSITRLAADMDGPLAARLNAEGKAMMTDYLATLYRGQLNGAPPVKRRP